MSEKQACIRHNYTRKNGEPGKSYIHISSPLCDDDYKRSVFSSMRKVEDYARTDSFVVLKHCTDKSGKAFEEFDAAFECARSMV